MLIGKKYKIESDSLNVTVFQKATPRKKKDGTMTEVKGSFSPIGYFPTVKSALKFLVDKEVNDTHLTDLRTVVKKQEELHKLIDNLNLS